MSQQAREADEVSGALPTDRAGGGRTHFGPLLCL